MDSTPCQVIGSLAMLSTEVSVLLLTYLTLEKYVCIVYPFQYVTPGWRRTASILLGIWVFGLFIAFLPLACTRLFRNFYGTNGVCFPLHSEQPETPWAHGYSIVIFLGLNLLAFLVIVLSYASMFYNIQTTGTQTTKHTNHLRKEVTIAKSIHIIIIIIIIINRTICSWVVIFILPINSALNPILYTLTTRPFKETLVQVWSNYRQQRPLLSAASAHHPSLTWQEVWPLQEHSHSHLTPPDKVEVTPLEKVHFTPPNHVHLDSPDKVHVPPQVQAQTTPEHKVHLSPQVQVQAQTTPEHKVHLSPQVQVQAQTSPEHKVHLSPQVQVQAQTTPEHKVRLSLHQILPPNQIQPTPPGNLHPPHQTP
ncbi:hypothetical protein CRUP_037345 [Coryphaenoides rupestris]|nr:hypothetical protein CRUP_037345 [Coryphaenoides rupestris]